MADDVATAWFNNQGNVVQALADPTSSGNIVTGISRLAQSVAYQLMTRKGEVPFSPDGCGFVDGLLAGNVATETDVFVLASMSLVAVRQRLMSLQKRTDPPEERLATARIGKLILSPGNINLTITVTNAARNVAHVTLPLNFLLY
jgi:hypothetical protein